jgi:PHD/YefM family antitoxin component YafN of YafNO toxin-antitoxin module
VAIVLNIKPKYLVNEKGRKTAAVLSMKDYRSLMQRLEDLEDALDLDQAVETATDFREYGEIRAELQKEGKL